MGQVICRSIMFFEDANLVPIPTAEPKLILVQPALNFLVPFIPTQLSFTFLVAVSGLQANTAYNFEIRITDPKEVVINVVPWVIEAQQVQLVGGATEGSGIMTNTVKNMVIRNKGRHALQVYFNKTLIGEQYFDIMSEEEGSGAIAH